MNVVGDKSPVPVRGGVPLSCKHCGLDRFAHRRSQLNTAVLSFFDLDWLNASADVYVCEHCGYLHWFFGTSILPPSRDDAPPRPEKVPADDTSAGSQCLSCGESIPAGADACPGCGWSYR